MNGNWKAIFILFFVACWYVCYSYLVKAMSDGDAKAL